MKRFLLTILAWLSLLGARNCTGTPILGKTKTSPHSILIA